MQKWATFFIGFIGELQSQRQLPSVNTRWRQSSEPLCPQKPSLPQLGFLRPPVTIELNSQLDVNFRPIIHLRHKALSLRALKTQHGAYPENSFDLCRLDKWQMFGAPPKPHYRVTSPMLSSQSLCGLTNHKAPDTFRAWECSLLMSWM